MSPYSYRRGLTSTSARGEGNGGNKRGHSEFSQVTMRDLREETSMSIYILP